MRVAVFTGSATGPAAHVDAAASFARGLALAGATVVYGGGRTGLMGVVADAALAAGGEVVGVVPQTLVEHEVTHRGLTRLDVVADLHGRKARMAELADAFVALPGGAGTLEEVFEVSSCGSWSPRATSGRPPSTRWAWWSTSGSSSPSRPGTGTRPAASHPAQGACIRGLSVRWPR
jgi:uncharacterized protein (TIGR00730 family)